MLQPLFLSALAFSLLAAPDGFGAKLQPKTQAAWEKYVRLTEQRIERDLQQEIAERPAGDLNIT